MDFFFFLSFLVHNKDNYFSFGLSFRKQSSNCMALYHKDLLIRRLCHTRVFVVFYTQNSYLSCFTCLWCFAGVSPASFASFGRRVQVLPLPFGLHEEQEARLFGDRPHHHEPSGGECKNSFLL